MLVLRWPLWTVCQMLPWARASAMYLCIHCLWRRPIYLCAGGKDGSGGPVRAAFRPGPLTLQPPFKPCAVRLGTLFCTPHLTSVAEGWEPQLRGSGWATVLEPPFSYPTQGRFTIAAKHHISIAEIYETELVDIEKVSGLRALPGRQQEGLQQPVSWDPDSSHCLVHSGESSGV